ncbi:MAG: MFS transporter, partial [Gemmatimonadota bacterium]
SLVGTWMQRVAMSWLVYRLSESAFLLGVVGFASRIPTLLVGAFAGVIADRWNRRRILYVTQALSMLQALAIAALVLSGTVRVWHVVALALFLGVLNAFDIPARQAYFVHMIDDEGDLGNAIALNSSVFNLARLIGPSVAGLLIAAVGEGLVFGLNGLTYLAMIAALAQMRTVSEGVQDRSRRVIEHLRDGFSFAYRFTPVRAVLLLVMTTSFFAVPFIILMPVFATDVLGGGPDTLGFLMTAQGVGALAGALFLAARETNRGLGRLIALAVATLGTGLILFSASRSLWLSLPLLAVAGFGLMVQMASSNTFLQTAVDDELRGRIMSLYTMSFMGTLPLGSLYAGAIAERIGAPATVAIGGTIALAAAAVFTRLLPGLREEARARYAERREAAD